MKWVLHVYHYFKTTYIMKKFILLSVVLLAVSASVSARINPEDYGNIRVDTIWWEGPPYRHYTKIMHMVITNAGTKAARFLNYEIKVQNANDYIQNGRRTANGVIGLFVPKDVIDEKCAKYMKKGKTIHRGELLQDDDFSIVAKYQSEYRGIVQYYILAQNLCWVSKLHWIMEGSLLKTLAFKHRSTMKKVKAKYQSENVDKRTGKTLKCLKVVVERKDKRPLIAQWGGISLVHQRHAVIVDAPYQVRG